MNEQLKDILAILEKLINYPSVSGDKKQTELLLDYVKSILPNDLYITDYEFDGYKSLVISNTESKDLDLVFCTHIDVVPCEKYEYNDDGKFIHGRGAIDMKGGVAVCLNLFIKEKSNKKVALFITSDEEIAGNCAKQLADIYNPKFVVIPDGGKDFNLIVEEKGLFQLKLSTVTKSAHASQPYNGVNAITKLFNCYEKLISKYPLPLNSDDYKTSINLSKINGGDALNKVPDYAEMYLDIRHTSIDSKDDLLSAITDIDHDIKVEIIGSGNVFKTDPNNDYIQNYLKVCNKVLGFNPNIIATESTSDGIYFTAKNIPTVIMNPKGDFAHCPNEYVEKESLLLLYEIYKDIFTN